MQNKKPLIALGLLLAAGLLIFFLLSGNKAKAAEPPADGGGVQDPPLVTPRFTPQERQAILDKGKSITDTLGAGKVVKTTTGHVLQKSDGSQVQITEEEAKAVSFLNKTNKITGKK